MAFNSVDGSASLATSDFALDGEVWTIRIHKESVESIGPNRVGEYIFDIEFRDVCWDSSLTPPAFTDTQFIFDLWCFEQLFFTEMVDNSQGTGSCGGYTSVLEYVSGPALAAGQDPTSVDLSHYTAVP